MSSLFQELRQRKVFRVAAGYAAISWAFAEAGSVIFPEMLIPDWVFRALLTLILLGFPAALILAWAFERTPTGIRRTQVTGDPSERKARRIEFGLIVLVSLVLVTILGNRYVLNPDGAGGETAAVSSADLEPSIAVLPFVNMSPDPNQEYFSDGISEELLNLLAQVPALKVAGRTSSFAFKGHNEDMRKIGETLGVSYLVEGSVRKSKNRVRITAQLVRASDGIHLWSEDYQRELTDIFAVQDEIADAIVGELKSAILPSSTEIAALPKAPETDASVFDLYLAARAEINSRDRAKLEDARDKLNAALEIDRSYAPALSAVGEVDLLLAENSYGVAPLPEALKSAKGYIERALVIDPTLAEAHAVKGFWYRNLHNIELSNASLDRALELNPSLANALNWRALNDIFQGKYNSAAEYIRRAADADPLWLLPIRNYVSNLYMLPSLREQGRKYLNRFLQFSPDNAQAHATLGQLDRYDGRLAHSLAALKKAMSADPADTNIADQAGLTYFVLSDPERCAAIAASPNVRAFCEFAAGNTDAAQEAVARMNAANPGDPTTVDLLAFVEDGRGNFDEVIRLLTGLARDLEELDARLNNLPDALALQYPLLIHAYRAVGDEKDADQVLSIWRRNIDGMSPDLANSAYHDLALARLEAVEGDQDQALALLQSHADKGGYFWFPDLDPAFRDMRDLPAYGKLRDQLRAHVGQERVKAGLDAS